MTLIDSGVPVARQTAQILIKNELLFENDQNEIARIECYVSGNNAEGLKVVLQHLIPSDLSWNIHNITVE